MKGSNRLHPVNTDIVLLSNHLYILLISKFYIDICIVTPRDRDVNLTVQKKTATVVLILCRLMA
jgi:hypothetical protein